MVVLGEPVGLVADILQQPQGVAVPAEMQRLVGIGSEDEFFTLGQ